MEGMQVQHKELIKERNKINDNLRRISTQKHRPESEVLIVKRRGEEVQEFPYIRKKRSRSPKKVDFQVEKPPMHEDKTSERCRNQKILTCVLSHLKSARDGLNCQKEIRDNQQKIDENLTQEIKKVAEEIKIQTREEIAKIKKTELKEKKELEEEIIKLEYEMQKTGQVKRVEAYWCYILTVYYIYRTIPPIFYLPVAHNDYTKTRLSQSIQRIELRAGVWKKALEEQDKKAPPSSNSK
ncbi:hypothetical protein SteCoe_1978 [Stentor coeruleus]|uniref:Pinin/SDK/MemA protein domain-containing protein n=1 Tax=Stentor coeruleus TaxID=5963 RepID=A0A1R2D0L9_9CILI|nr:hypothetical protein SteCoe_1978 [Stentor coeruleus]